MSKCPKPLSVRKAATSKLAYYSKKNATSPSNIHLGLAEVCYQMGMGQNADDRSASQHDLSPSFESVPNDTEIIGVLLSSADVNINLAHVEDSKTSSSTEPVGSSKDTIEVDATLDSDCEVYLLTVFEDMTDEDEEILSMSTEGKHERADYLAACIDTGAQRSAIRKPQAEAYYSFMGISFRLKQSGQSRVYKF